MSAEEIIPLPPDFDDLLLAPVQRRPRAVHPLPPMGEEEYQSQMALSPSARVTGMFRCPAPWLQGAHCSRRIIDPRVSRYCAEHRGIYESLSPGEESDAVTTDTRANLTRLIPKALSVAETVMDDNNNPAGVRLKAAETLLDRAGVRAGSDIFVQGEGVVVDIGAIIAERLDRLAPAQPDVVVGEIASPAIEAADPGESQVSGHTFG